LCTDATYYAQVHARVNGQWTAGWATRLDVAPAATSPADCVPPAPVVKFSADPLAVQAGGAVTLSWTARFASVCAASDGWSGTRPAQGQVVVDSIARTTLFTLVCSGPSGNTLAQVLVPLAAPPRPTRLEPVSTTSQATYAGTTVYDPPAVRVEDQYGRPMPGVAVAFASTSTGAGALIGPSTVTTDAGGVARVDRWRLSRAPGMQVATAAAAGAGEIAFEATGFDPSAMSVAERIAPLRLANWYPARHVWTNFWLEFDEALVTREFALLADIGFNAVRIFPTATLDAFAVPQPTVEMLRRLRRTIEIADAAGLKVQLSLFDIWADYGRLAESRAWVDAVVGPYRNDSRIVYIDVQNEVDLRQAGLRSWLGQIAPYVRQMAGNIPVTASLTQWGGLSHTHFMQLLKGTFAPDLFDVHIYSPPQIARVELGQVRAEAAGLPVYIGESGFPTVTDFEYGTYGVPKNLPAQEAQQQRFILGMHAVVRSLGFPVPGHWTLNDFDRAGVPSYLVDYITSLGTGSVQYSYGLRRVDGTPKPALADMMRLQRAQVSTSEPNAGFELVDPEGQPLHWRIWNNPAAGYSASFRRDASVAHSGQASARIDGATGGMQGTPAYYLVPLAPFVPGAPVTARAYGKAAGLAGSGHVTISWFDASFGFLGLARSASLPKGESDWTLLEVQSAPPPAAAYYEVRLESENNPAGTVWFDDVSWSQ
jgi:hypothetical protein